MAHANNPAFVENMDETGYTTYLGCSGDPRAVPAPQTATAMKAPNAGKGFVAGMYGRPSTGGASPAQAAARTTVPQTTSY